MSLLSRLAVSAARAYGVLSKGGVSANFLVVAGGGSGGLGYDDGSQSRVYGGGGAGGFRTSAGTSGGGALAESAIVEKALYIKNRKFVNIRYGNVLNSRGSIIPILHEKGKDPTVKEFTLTHQDMTRFVMTLDQSVALIEYAILEGESGDTIIPSLVSMKMIHLMEIFSEKYNKPIIITGLRPGEKMLESLISETQSMRLVKKESGYMHIKPCYYIFSSQNNEYLNYNSQLNPLSKEELIEFINELKLI